MKLQLHETHGHAALIETHTHPVPTISLVHHMCRITQQYRVISAVIQINCGNLSQMTWETGPYIETNVNMREPNVSKANIKAR